MARSLKAYRDELAPGVFGWLGEEAWIIVDVATDSLEVGSPWGGFVVTRKAIEDGSAWKVEFGRQMAQLREKRDAAEH
jgi:hypothetical protein